LTLTRIIPTQAEAVRIEAAARATGLTKRTIRYYEEIGLLPPASRSEAGQRLYTEDDLHRLERVKQLKDTIGLSLAEIHELLEAESARDLIRERYRHAAGASERERLIDEAIAVIRRQLAVVVRKRESLAAAQVEFEDRLARLQQLKAELEREAASPADAARP
jgi:DNA-binding transcriptional MerR regulator